jgi:Peptidase family M28
MRRPAILIAAVFAALVAHPLAAQTITEKALRAHIAVLASDDFEGRAVGTVGEQKTIRYIAEQWKKAKLTPAAKDGNWFDPVALVQRGPSQSKFGFALKDRKLRFVADESVLIGRDPDYQKLAVPLFFGGYGVKPDGTALDGVKGKAVIILFERPENGGMALSHSLRTRREALINAGAEAVIIVADNNQGNWSALRRQMLSRPIALESRDLRAPLEIAVSSEFAVGLVTSAGRDWDKLRAHLKDDHYSGEDLGVTGDFDVKTDVHRFSSHNVLGKIPGKKKGSGAVLMLAHWDHLGICEPESAQDKICNGAVDNASGIAVLTEVARVMARKRPDRDVYFLATTAEESGLLGAYAFTQAPSVPLKDIVIALNLDTIAITPRHSKVAIIGRGYGSLEGNIESVAKRAGRVIDTTNDANSFLQRQDGWALNQAGVPSYMVNGAFSDLERLQKFLSSRYHGPDDELDESTDLSGATQDAALHLALGTYFASTRSFPAIKGSGKETE